MNLDQTAYLNASGKHVKHNVVFQLHQKVGQQAETHELKQANDQPHELNQAR